jgi:hypothetical protein
MMPESIFVNFFKTLNNYINYLESCPKTKQFIIKLHDYVANDDIYHP